jgi:hypothetical protein
VRISGGPLSRQIDLRNPHQRSDSEYQEWHLFGAGADTTAAASAAQESGKDASVSADKRLVGLTACSTGIEPAPASQSFSASTRGLKKAISQMIKSIKHQQIQ